jgi:predicted site-specific integrase-resolvase
MLIKFKGENYCKTSEVARLAGISRSTLLRWFYDSIIKNQSLGDRRGWRPFKEAEIKKVEEEVNKMKNRNQLSQFSI